MDARHTARSVELPNGVRVSFAEQGDPTGVPLVFLPGLGDSWRAFEPVLFRLPRWIHAFALTLRGHGDSSRPAEGYRSTDFAGDLAAFMAELGIEAAVVAGGSSGGLVAQRFASDRPERTLGLALLGSPLTLGDNKAVREQWDSTFSKLADPVDPDFVRGFVEGMLVRPVPRAFRDAMVQEALKVPARVWKEALAGFMEDDFCGQLRRIDAPALIIWGDRDALLPRSDQERMAAAIGQARLVVLHGAGHMLYWEEPGRVASQLADFASRLVPRLDARGTAPLR